MKNDKAGLSSSGEELNPKLKLKVFFDRSMLDFDTLVFSNEDTLPEGDVSSPNTLDKENGWSSRDTLSSPNENIVLSIPSLSVNIYRSFNIEYIYI